MTTQNADTVYWNLSEGKRQSRLWQEETETNKTHLKADVLLH